MFRWHGILVSMAVMALVSVAPAHAFPIRVNFTVFADPADPVLSGVSATGYFIFDSDLAPWMGGSVNTPEIATISFAWGGTAYSLENALVQYLTFQANGTLVDFRLQSNGCCGGTFPWLMISVPTNPSFGYALSDGASRAGSLAAWDAATVPLISAFTESGTGHLYALTSMGDLYMVPTAGVGCDPLGSGQRLGSMFNGPPPSPVANAGTFANGFWVCLQNGDVYSWCSASGTGILAGNMFAAAGVTGVGQQTRPLQGQIAPARPNPFNPATRIPYTLASGGRVAIRVYDAAGRLVRTIEDGQKPRGSYTATWGGETDDETKAGSGTYFLRITYPDGTNAEQKLTVLK